MEVFGFVSSSLPHVSLSMLTWCFLDVDVFFVTHSFAFWDWNPSENIESIRCARLGEVIRNNNRAVIAEQLASYLEPKEEFLQSVQSESISIDEAFVLPALIRFGGHAEVTDDGDIIYVSPDLRVTTHEDYESADAEEKVGYLKQKTKPFSPFSDAEDLFGLTA